MFYTRATLCAVLLLGGLIGAAQTAIRIAPPPPVRVGVVGVAPGPGYVWVAGHWVRPPRVGVGWVSPRYVHTNGGWVFRKGYWR
jgi:hypothetical protein